MDALAPVDLSTCADEPIHIPGAIQPFGCLLVVEQPGWNITNASANSEQILGHAADRLVGRELASVLGSELVHRLRNALQMGAAGEQPERLYDAAIGDDSYDISLHRAGRRLLIDIEPQREEGEPIDALALVNMMLARLKGASDLDRFYDIAARQVRAVTGFDRVMVYKFQEDGSGHVIAEARSKSLTPYLDLHYPASDIPAQARALYRKNWVRIIPDVGYDRVPLVPDADADGAPIDLGLSALRSVSPIHIEYLQNMGVSATLTISILRDGELWGLFACHHYAPRYLSVARRAATEMFGQLFSLLVETKENAARNAHISAAREVHDRLVAKMAPEATVFDNLAAYQDLALQLIAADGLGVWVGGQFSGVGTHPPAEQLGELVEFLNEVCDNDVFATRKLSDIFPASGAYAGDVSGVLAVPVSRTPRDYLLFFRKEVVETVTWGGDPHKPASYGPNGARLTPRKSFDAWKETVRFMSKPWADWEIDVARTLRVALLEILLKQTSATERIRKSAQERQEVLIAELNHRVKNILALVRSIISRTRDKSQSLGDFVETIQGRIDALSTAHEQMITRNWSSAPLRRLAEYELKPYDNGTRDLRIIGPGVGLDPRAFSSVALVIHELTTNAAKYGALSVEDGQVSIKWALDDRKNLELWWQERDGPPVTKPKEKGFGSTVIERSLTYELQGTSELEYDPDGVNAYFKIPRPYVVEELAAPSRPDEPRPKRPEAIGEGQQILLVEDNMIIALDGEEMLRQMGFMDVSVAGTPAEARELLRERDFDVAVLDVNLGTETSFDLAEDLQARGIPFVFATGYGEGAIIPNDFKDIALVAKPYSSSVIEAALVSILTRDGRESAEA